MILIEDTDLQSIENLVERAGENGPKNYIIRGIFAQAEKKNGNGRIYPMPIMEREVKGLCEGKIAQSRLVGELGHPNSIEIGLDRVSHKINSLVFEKNDVLGEALIGDTPCGKIAKALIDRGFHPPTIYFPMIVKEAIMIEPTETESKATMDAFIEVMIEAAQTAESNPQALHDAPLTMPISRLDETKAAREQNVCCAW